MAIDYRNPIYLVQALIDDLQNRNKMRPSYAMEAIACALDTMEDLRTDYAQSEAYAYINAAYRLLEDENTYQANMPRIIQYLEIALQKL